VRVSRRRGRLRLLLEPVEVDLVGALLGQLESVLDGPKGDGADDVRGRLSPAAYPDDPDAAAEFRELTEAALHSERIERIAACRADLADGGEVELSEPETAQRWIKVLNDLRLAFGTRLGVTEEDSHAFDPGAPDADLRAVYHWLTEAQDLVVGELMH
jgi:Domain of unknown function (DUF2017)